MSLALMSLLLVSPSADPFTVKEALVTVIAQVDVPAEEAGVLEELNVDIGKLVQKDEDIGRIDDKLNRIEDAVARVEYEIAKIQAANDVDLRFAERSKDLAQAELDRYLGAIERYAKSISESEMDQQRLQLKRATLSHEQAVRDREIASLTEEGKKLSTDLADERTQRRRIKSPLTGMVVRVLKHRGEWLSPGEPVVRIIRLDRMRVEAFVDGNKHGQELKGCPVTLTATVPPSNRTKQFKGNIIFVSPEQAAGRGGRRVVAEVENPDLYLSAGQSGSLTITPRK